jgi:hypothetical protein
MARPAGRALCGFRQTITALRAVTNAIGFGGRRIFPGAA